MNDVPKYALLEIERRWLVDLATVDLGNLPCREIEDLYIAGSRLRLRKVSGPTTEVVFKLGKKYGKSTPWSEPITNLYLTADEHRSLSVLPGTWRRKRRYAVAEGALDVYLEPEPGLAIYEAEFPNEEAARSYRPPSFVRREITLDSVMSGMSVAKGA